MKSAEQANATEQSRGVIGIEGHVGEQAHATGVYSVQCHDADGNLIWSQDFPNTVLTAGKNDALDKYLAGSSYTAAFYLGLISTSGYSAIVAGDTAASHAGWTESTAYSNSTRVAASFAAASSGSKALSSGAVFNVNGTDTIKGCFLATVSTKGGTTGVFYSAGLFTGGDQPVVSGNTLTVSYSAAL